jgi:stringent starvation protein B
MTSSKPYLIRGLYEWLLDNQATPYMLADTSNPDVMIPRGIATDGKVVLNLSPSAIENLEMTNEYVSFSARFSGVAQDIYCPMASILAIYARENGEGMMFNQEAKDAAENGVTADGPGQTKKPNRPGLKVVK